MIKNQDGTPYKASGEIKSYQNNNPSHCLMDAWDAESIRRGGSPLYYYEVFIQQGTIDPIYLEDRGKIFSNIPIVIYTSYEPTASQNYQSIHGIDSLEDVIFETNYTDVLNRIGHPPKIGSRIHSPHLGEDWILVQRNLAEFKNWGKFRLNLICSKFQESSTTGEGKITQNNKPDYEID